MRRRHQGREDFPLFGFHFAPLSRRALVVVSPEMKDPVNQQEENLFAGLATRSPGLPFRCVGRDDYIP